MGKNKRQKLTATHPKQVENYERHHFVKLRLQHEQSGEVKDVTMSQHELRQAVARGEIILPSPSDLVEQVLQMWIEGKP